MVTKHFTDEELQLFAFENANPAARIAEHLRVCEACKAKVDVYHALFAEIKIQPSPSFDFDLAATVLQQLPLPTQKTLTDRSLTWVFICIYIVIIGTGFYFFGSYLDSLFKGVAAIFIYLIVISAITVIVAVFFDMYKKYRDEMKILDLY